MYGTRALILVTLLGLSAGCGNKQTAEVAPKPDYPVASVDSPVCAPTARAAEAREHGQKVLAGVTLTESTPLSDIVAAPADWNGKRVRIEGSIVEVCAKRGCFAALSDGAGHAVNLKVKDGDVDFRELAATGQYAIGEGELSERGEHGVQVFVTGALISRTVCR